MKIFLSYATCRKMTSVAGLNNFNNLLFNTKKNEIANIQEHKAGRVPMDLRYKYNAKPTEVLTCGISQLNGKQGDLKYKPKILQSRPYFGYDARIDTTILNAIRNKYVDVSGVLVPNKYLRLKPDANMTARPFETIGVVH